MTHILKTTLGALYQAFTTDKRNNGESFVRLVDGAAEWMHTVVRECHGGMLPDDTRYQMIRDVLADLVDRCDHDDDTDADALRDDVGEIADSLVDVYNSSRLRWLASHIERPGYVDEAQREGLISDETDTMDRIGIGQYLEYREICEQLIECCERVTESLTSDDESEA
jgi:hypothetical protein